MGWNEVAAKKTSALTANFDADARFYFVHSYHVVPADSSDILMISTYGYEFVAMVQHDNIYGAQFHPEKSHKYGMKLLKNFGEL